VKQQLEIRTEVLVSFGAEGKVADELLRYNENRFQDAAMDISRCPLPDESFVAAWREYARETDAACSITPLAQYMVQLRFPIQEAISASTDYIAVTRRGFDPDGMETAVGLPFRDPQKCRLVIHPTAAGSLPVLIATEREDFVSLVRALTHRNEPHPIPDSMGACMVVGYNNWHRVSRLRDRFLASASANDSWPEEFQRIKAQKELYQDRFIILSSGPYSAVNASDIGLDREEWLNISLAIRREHECTHYFTQRVFLSMRNNLLDELIADYMGITAAIERFRADWLLRFYGLESFPRYREGGRLQNYRGDPPLSESAFVVLQKMVVAACTNLENFDRRHTPALQRLQVRAGLLLMLTNLTVEEMAARDAHEILDAAFTNALRSMEAQPLSETTIAGPELVS